MSTSGIRYLQFLGAEVGIRAIAEFIEFRDHEADLRPSLVAQHHIFLRLCGLPASADAHMNAHSTYAYDTLSHTATHRERKRERETTCKYEARFFASSFGCSSSASTCTATSLAGKDGGGVGAHEWKKEYG